MNPPRCGAAALPQVPGEGTTTTSTYNYILIHQHPEIRQRRSKPIRAAPAPVPVPVPVHAPTRTMGCTPSKGGGDLSTTERVMGGRVAIDKSERINSKSERARLAKERAKVLKAHNASSSSPPPLPPKLDAGGHLTAEEVARRVSGSVESQEALVGDLRSGSAAEGVIRVRYAALTQRGYYPDNPHKENQDSYFMCPSKFASGDGDAFFAVFDGHGDDGHDCARFAKARLPVFLAGAIKKRRAAANAARLRAMAAAGQEKPPNAFHPTNWPHLEEGEYEACCREAHLRCNAAMQAAKEVRAIFFPERSRANSGLLCPALGSFRCDHMSCHLTINAHIT